MSMDMIEAERPEGGQMGNENSYGSFEAAVAPGQVYQSQRRDVIYRTDM